MVVNPNPPPLERMGWPTLNQSTMPFSLQHERTHSLPQISCQIIITATSFILASAWTEPWSSSAEVSECWTHWQANCTSAMKTNKPAPWGVLLGWMHYSFGTTSVTLHLTTPSLIHTWKLFIVTVMKIYRATPVECFNVCVFTCNLRGALGGNMVSIMAVIMATSGRLQSILKPHVWHSAQRGVHWRILVFYKLQRNLVE